MASVAINVFQVEIDSRGLGAGFGLEEVVWLAIFYVLQPRLRRHLLPPVILQLQLKQRILLRLFRNSMIDAQLNPIPAFIDILIQQPHFIF